MWYILFRTDNGTVEVPAVDPAVQEMDGTSRRKSCKVQKSPVWKYFIPGVGQARCALCSKQIKRTGGNTSNLIAHLRSNHCNEYNVVARRRTGATRWKLVRELVVL